MSDDWQVVEQALIHAAGNAIVLPPGHFQEERDKMRDAMTVLARLREREAQLTDEARKNFDWAKAERSGRKQERTRADQAAARVAELEQQVASATQACNVAVTQAMKLEETLDRISRLDTRYGHVAVKANEIARRALAHKEETP